ncbi:transglycosylase domain-containing protein [Fructilactobacillus sp. Tb1]|uniref:transglycosylase domain-containing protein n=1 Tax=Fructilactobacillus sp. Tb1 TaxID=3422304 RepID=UPI003D2D7D39
MDKEKIISFIKQYLGILWDYIKKYLSILWNFIKKYWKRYQLTRWIIAIILFIMVISSIYLTFIAKTSHVKNLQSNLSRSTVIYDQNGKKAGNLYAQKGTYVASDKISPNLSNAIIATEDRNFYHEHGFSVKGYARAILLAIKNKIMHDNQISSGGSTISQQLAKNTFLSQQQTLSRKFKELFISIEIENIYSKKQIITMYMNNAYFGNGVYGVQDASRKYFGMDAKDLPVQDAATLAGMLQNPSNNPIDHPEAAKARRNVVIGLMGETGKIPESEVKTYQSKPMEVHDDLDDQNGYKYPYYFDAVINEAISQYGLSEKQIMNDGYKIYTSLNQQQQQSFQDDFKDPSLFPSNASDGTKVQAASIAVNPKNGGVQAVVGGRGDTVFRGYNRATDMRRQPGSALKPLSVYTPALENGFSYDSMLNDKLQSYGKNHYTPQNFSQTYTGKIPMYKAIAESLNAPAVWTLNKIGVDKGYDSLQKFGIPVTKKDNNLAIALGGLTTGVSPQQMAGAYTAFANQGKVSTPFYITKIVDSTGKTVATHENNTSQIISADTARQMTSMLLDVFQPGGTSATGKPSGYEVAGKTGTTEDDTSSDNQAVRDWWVIGYTPDVVVASWEGFDNTNSDKHLEIANGSNSINTLFKNQMQDILPYTDGNKFKVKDANTRYMQKQQDSLLGDDNSSNSTTNNIREKLGQVSQKASDVAHNLVDDVKSFLGQ